MDDHLDSRPPLGGASVSTGELGGRGSPGSVLVTSHVYQRVGRYSVSISSSVYERLEGYCAAAGGTPRSVVEQILAGLPSSSEPT